MSLTFIYINPFNILVLVIVFHVVSKVTIFMFAPHARLINKSPPVSRFIWKLQEMLV